MEHNSLMRTWRALHFVPFLGPARYAVEAIIAYIYGDDTKARNKGIKAAINGLIDIVVLSIFVISATHIAVECEKTQNLKLIKPVLTFGIIAAVAAILIGSKIVAEQMSNAVVEKVLIIK